MTLFLILATAFVLVGVWISIYSKKRKRLVTDVARKRGMSHRDRDDGSLEQELDKEFGLKAPYVRGFSRIRDIVADGGVTMFRVTELMDLVPYARAQNTHSWRIAAYFDVPQGPDVIFDAGGQTGYRPLYPPDYDIGTDARFGAVKGVVAQNPPPHTLSVTLMRGKALIYLQPLITGGEKQADIEYLYELAKKMKAALNAV